MPHQQMIPVQINHQQLNYQVKIENNVLIIFISSSFINVLPVYQYEDRDTGQPVIVSADGQQVYIDGSCQVKLIFQIFFKFYEEANS